MKYFDGYKVRTVISVTMKLIEAIFEIFIPLHMTRLIDFGIIQNNPKVIYSSVMWMVLLTLFGYASSLICQVNASIISQAIGGRIRSDLFKHDLVLTTQQVDKFSSSTLTNRITTDTIFIQDMIARIIRLGSRAPFLIGGTLIALMYINQKLAIILAITIPILSAIIFSFMWLTTKAHEKSTHRLDRIISKVSELLSGSRIIRAFSKQEEFDVAFEEENETLFKANTKVGLLSTLSNPFTTLFMNLLLILLIYISGVEISLGNMTQGQTLAVINYTNQLLITLIMTMNLIMLISRGSASTKRVKQVLREEPYVIDEGINELDTIKSVSFNNVSYGFPNEKRRVLKNINFEINKGQSLGIIGLTGSGKSTLLRLFPRFMDTSEGSILINGESIDTFKIDDLRNTMGYVPQYSMFLRGSLEDNILMGKRTDAKKALCDAQGQDILSKGMDTIIEENGKNLSGGQKQRVNIARALAKDSEILLLDDSFSALDALTTKNLQQVLKESYKDSIQIIASQRTSSVSSCDLILVLDQGEIVAQGSHNTLLIENDIYREIHRLQSEGSENI